MGSCQTGLLIRHWLQKHVLYTPRTALKLTLHPPTHSRCTQTPHPKYGVFPGYAAPSKAFPERHAENTSRKIRSASARASLSTYRRTLSERLRILMTSRCLHVGTVGAHHTQARHLWGVGEAASCKVALPPNLLQDSHTPSANHQESLYKESCKPVLPETRMCFPRTSWTCMI